MSKEALEEIYHILKSTKTKDSARLAAACAILDRGFGKPAQAVQMSMTRVLSRLSDEDLRVLIGIVEKVELAAQSPPPPMLEGVVSKKCDE